jgi:hypothetical protein
MRMNETYHGVAFAAIGNDAKQLDSQLVLSPVGLPQQARHL